MSSTPTITRSTRTPVHGTADRRALHRDRFLQDRGARGQRRAAGPLGRGDVPLERAVAIDPTYAPAWNNRAIACEQQGTSTRRSRPTRRRSRSPRMTSTSVRTTSCSSGSVLAAGAADPLGSPGSPVALDTRTLSEIPQKTVPSRWRARRAPRHARCSAGGDRSGGETWARNWMLMTANTIDAAGSCNGFVESFSRCPGCA